MSLVELVGLEEDENVYQIAGQGGGSCRSYGWSHPPFCYVCFRATPLYLLVLSLFAMVVIIGDNVEMFKCCGVPASDWRCLVPETSVSLMKSVRQFMGGLSFLMYLHLFLGVIFKNPYLLVPYLVVQILNVLLSTVVLILALATRRRALNRSMFLQFVFMVVIWIQCYCHFLFLSPKCSKRR
ncbi:hypothetical protein GE061_018241 [Apolygus lucorum]|uniref:Uncharacterized protein n=1 Tax=Apolygus lucorum TaxID=248454 RepID=A0A8S9XEQ2_APOLU|nr:hypothetical protein GE061_018241 [Apolygus lucorum]